LIIAITPLFCFDYFHDIIIIDDAAIAIAITIDIIDIFIIDIIIITLFDIS